MAVQRLMELLVGAVSVDTDVVVKIVGALVRDTHTHTNAHAHTYKRVFVQREQEAVSLESSLARQCKRANARLCACTAVVKHTNLPSFLSTHP